tara:strand:+ start:575 stop:841 length:267 start_codon:yes stop_codon:yes gene_type:complete
MSYSSGVYSLGMPLNRRDRYGWHDMAALGAVSKRCVRRRRVCGIEHVGIPEKAARSTNGRAARRSIVAVIVECIAGIRVPNQIFEIVF